MSRLENKAKAGFFPTPEGVAEMIASHMEPWNYHQPFRAVDPCAGEGEALSTVLNGIGGSSYSFGIELDENRAMKAAEKVWNVLAASYEAVRTPKESFGLLWLNPPYDADTSQPGRRLEYAFLKRTVEWLAPGGILVYLIPDYRISKNIATLLASRFDNVRVFRFPGETYDTFKQVAIMASKRTAAVINEEEAARLLSFAETPAPVLERSEDRATRYMIPLIEKDETQFYFRITDADAKDLAAEAKASGAWGLQDLSDALNPGRPEDVRPLLPLKRGHVAMLLAAGCLGNMVLTDDESGRRILIKGQLEKKAVDRTRIEDEPGTTRTLETFSATIETVDLVTGEIVRIEDEGGLREWFTKWKDPLLSHISRTTQPAYVGDLTAHAKILNSLSRDRRLPGRRETGLFEAQKHVAAATAEFLSGPGKTVVIQATMGTGKTTMAVAIAELLWKTARPRS